MPEGSRVSLRGCSAFPVSQMLDGVPHEISRKGAQGDEYMALVRRIGLNGKRTWESFHAWRMSECPSSGQGCVAECRSVSERMQGRVRKWMAWGQWGQVFRFVFESCGTDGDFESKLVSNDVRYFTIMILSIAPHEALASSDRGLDGRPLVNESARGRTTCLSKLRHDARVACDDSGRVLKDRSGTSAKRFLNTTTDQAGR